MLTRKYRLLTKYLLLAVSCLLFVGVVSGCSNKATESSTVQPGNHTEKKGTVTFPIFNRGNIPADEGTVVDNRWTKWIIENAPVNVKFVSIPFTGNYADLYNTFFAAGDAPDIVVTNSAVTKNNLYNQKQLMPLDDMVDKYSTRYKSILSQFPVLRKAGTMSDGKLYQVGIIKGLKPNHGLFIRTDWLKKLNLKVPETVDELFAVAKAFSEQDPDGNGQKDTYGMALSHITGLIVDAMFGDAGWIVKDDKLIHDWDRTKAKIEFEKRLFDAGIIDKDYLTDTKGQKAQQDWVNGKLGIFGYQTQGFSDYSIYATLMKNNPNAEAMVIPLPRSPFGQFSAVIDNPAAMTGVVNVNAKDKEAIMKFIDFMSEEKTMITLKNGIEGVHYKNVEGGCPQIIDQDKYNKEVAWNFDYQYFSSTYFLGKCSMLESQLDPTKPVDKSYIENVLKKTNEILSPERPIPTLTHPDHMPQLPKNLELINSNLSKPISDIWTKAIVSGSSYTTEQALNDAKSLWAKGQGDQLEKWYADWYVNNKDKAFLKEDMYKFKKPGDK